MITDGRNLVPARRGPHESVMEEIKAGEAESIPAEDLFEELGLNSDEACPPDDEQHLS